MPLSLFNIDSARDKTLRGIENMFRCFYNQTLNLPSDKLGDVLDDCISLLDIAENYDAVAPTAESIDISLLRAGTGLFRAIAKSPASWLKFGIRISSPTIFKEALIHLVGQWNTISEDQKEEIDDSLLPLVRGKVRYLSGLKAAVEVRILGHYHETIQKSITEQPSRANYANDIYPWMVVSYFRHWFAQQIASGNTKDAPDGGFKFYSEIFEGGQAYLSRRDSDAFYTTFPMTKKGKTIFDNHLTVYKNSIKQFARPILINRSQLELGGK